MAHPMKKEGVEGHNAKLKRFTQDYGAADPAMNKSAPVTSMKQEGEEDAVGFGADSAAPRARSDRPARRSTAANPLATYRKGGRIGKKRSDGGDVSAIEMANRNQEASKPTERARGGRTKSKNKGTHVNVIVAPQGGAPGAGAPAPVAPVLPPPAAAMPPPRPPMGPPMGGAMPPPGLMGAPGAPGGMPPGVMPPRARGGRLNHPDEAADRAMIKNMVKPSALQRAKGGKVTGMTAGALSGEGRLEKIALQRKQGHKEPQTV